MKVKLEMVFFAVHLTLIIWVNEVSGVDNLFDAC